MKNNKWKIFLFVLLKLVSRYTLLFDDDKSIYINI